MECAGPRKYKMTFECTADKASTIFGVLVKEVQTPTMNPSGTDTFKMTCVCFMDQIPSITGLIVSDIDKLVIAPLAEENVEAIRRFEPKPKPAVYSEAMVRKIPAVVPQRMKGRKQAETPAGRLVMEIFHSKPICHAPDFADVLLNGGYTDRSVSGMLHKLMREGSIVRCGRGAYRLPTEHERIEFRRKALGVEGLSHPSE